MKVRPACAQDAPAIAQILNNVIEHTLITFTTQQRSVEDVEDLIDQSTFLVLEKDEQVQGFASLGPFRSGPGYAHTCEHSIHLAQAAQGQGGGRLLMRELENVARIAGQHVMIGGISAENPRGIAFHAAMGFSEVGRLSEVGQKHGRWLDLVFMQKILNAA